MSMPPSMDGAANDAAYNKKRSSPYNRYIPTIQLSSGCVNANAASRPKKTRYHAPHPETAYMPPPPRNINASPTPPGARRYHAINHFPVASRNSSSSLYSLAPSDLVPGDEMEYPPPHLSERVIPYPHQRVNTPYPFYSSYRGHPTAYPSYYNHHVSSKNVSTKKRSNGDMVTTPPRNSLDPRFSCSPSTSHESGKTSCETNTTCSSSDSFVASPKQFHYQEQPPLTMDTIQHHPHPSMMDHRLMPYGTIPLQGMEPPHMYTPCYSSMPYYSSRTYNIHPGTDNNYLYHTKHPYHNTSVVPKYNTLPQSKKPPNPFPPNLHSISTNTENDDKYCCPTASRINGTAPSPESTSTYSRKDRALGLLCEKFLENCCYRPDRDWISIDEAARTLSVEKRRIYDIINILEAIHIVSRKCKDTYFWHGTTNLPVTFAKLQQHALSIWKQDGIQNGLILNTDTSDKTSDDDKADDGAASDVDNQKKETCGIQMLLESAKATTESVNGNDNTDSIIPPKEKSLARLCRCFIQLFLVGNDVISLNDACDKILEATGESNKIKESSLKTKVRRLYDVANVMVSLRIIVKVGNDKNGNPKNSRPIFKWIYKMSPKDMQMFLRKSKHKSDNKSTEVKKSI